MGSVGTTALVLVGGMGTRLRPVVADRPKPLAVVAGRPFLSYLLDQLIEAGVTEAVLCTGYRGEEIEAEFGARYRSLGLKYSQETERLDTAGALQYAMRHVHTDDVIVCNGDSYCAVDIAEFHAWFRRQGKMAGIVALDREDVRRYGQLRLDSAARVTAFDEKGHATGRGWINAGIYAFTRATCCGASPRIGSVVARARRAPVPCRRPVAARLARDGRVHRHRHARVVRGSAALLHPGARGSADPRSRRHRHPGEALPRRPRPRSS